VMPVVWHDFLIRPYDFCPANPALDLPKLQSSWERGATLGCATGFLRVH
jgi:hypothetical protein